MAIGVLVPIDPDRPVPPPEQRPISRAALRLQADGFEVVFGDWLRGGRMSGLSPRPGGWVAVVNQPVVAVLDRFPSQNRATRFAEIQKGLGDIPLRNGLGFTMLCRDKLRCQLLIESQGLSAPTVEADPARFAERLDEWGAGFLKPRFGALGIGVRRVVPGDSLPATLPGVVAGRPDPALLQRAILPPQGWKGWSVRVLAQRDPDAGWVLGEPVVRRSRKDPVVNAARGAEVTAGRDVLSPALLRRVLDQSASVAEVLGRDPAAIEIGVDLVIDDHEWPHLVEVNSRPRGRLEVLAARDPERFGALHAAACERPMRLVARQFDAGR